MDNKKRILVTTALKESWPVDGPVLFLGEWCKVYSSREKWLAMDAVVSDYHWDDLKKYDQDYKYLCDLYERLLISLSHKLNLLHQVEHSIRYWRVLIGPWLAYFLQTVFDRYVVVQDAIKNFNIVKTICIKEKEDAPTDMVEFINSILNDEWNHSMFIQIIKHCTKIPCDFITVVKDDVKCSNRKNSFKYYARSLYNVIARRFLKNDGVFIASSYLPLLSEMKLQLRMGQVPQLWESPAICNTPFNHDKRKWKKIADGYSLFEKFVIDIIPKHIPKSFLEGYKDLIHQSNTQPWPSHPKLIFTSNALWHQTVTMAYVAEKIDMGSALVYGQHGGVYGVAKYNWMEKHEVAISDRYLTWGWNKPDSKIIPLGILKIDKPPKKHVSNNNHTLLFVSLYSSRYTYILYRDLLSFYKKYFHDSFKFRNSLPEKIRQNLLVRGSSVDIELGWEQKQRWNDLDSSLNFDPGLLNMNDLFENCRIAVFTYNSTGFLEAFTKNIPSILFWDPVVNPLHDSAKPFFDKLKEVGILHETPESAAYKISTVWDDVDDWWNTPAIRNALSLFKMEYCRLSNNLVGEVKRNLQDVIHNNI